MQANNGRRLNHAGTYELDPLEAQRGGAGGREEGAALKARPIGGPGLLSRRGRLYVPPEVRGEYGSRD